MIVVGSTALKLQGIDLRDGKESDLDFVLGSDPIFYLQSKIEFLEVVVGFKVDAIELPQSIIDEIPFITSVFKYDTGYNPNFKIATIDAIYTLKLSHLPWDIKWQKHKSDILRLQKLGAKKIVKLYDALIKHWESVNTDKDRLNLYKKKSDFFDDYVPYVYDHDYLHEVVALPDKPIYSLCLKDGQEVAIDKDKFFALPFEQQLRMFQEEVTVIAAERWLIPKRKKKFHWLKAYSLSVHKTVTALTKGWATQFMIDNLDYYIRPNKELFIKLHNKGIIDMGSNMSDEEVNVLVKEIYLFWLKNIGESDSVEDAEELDTQSMLETIVYESDDDTDITLDGTRLRKVEVHGGESMGEYAHTIIEWKNKFYRFDYSYYSGDGYNFDYMTVKEVVPVQETVTVYK